MVSTPGRKDAGAPELPPSDAAVLTADTDPVGGPEHQRKSYRTRERILAAAWELFLERGFSESTIQDVAESAGVGKATVYYYVSSKEELLRLLVDATIGDFLARIEGEIAAMPDPVQRLRHVLFSHATLMVRTAPLIEAYHAEPEVGRGEFGARMGPRRADCIALVSRLIQEGKDAGDLDVDDPVDAARIIVGAIVGYFMQWAKFERDSGGAPDEASLTSFVMGGLLSGALTKRARA